MDIGFIGTGLMGKPMATNILATSNTLVVYARNPDKVGDLESKGAVLVDSPAEVASRVQFIVLSLPFDPEVEEVLRGPKGILDNAKPGLLIIDTTTGTPSSALRMAELAAEKKVGYVDAPVSGGVKGAENGSLVFMVGGEGKWVKAAQSVMEILGEKFFWVGKPGAGRAIKAVNQLICAMNTLTICETVVLAKKMGIEPDKYYEVLGQSAANSYHMQSKLPNFIIPGKFEGGHRIDMMLKDIEIGMDIAKQNSMPLMFCGLGAQIYRAGSKSVFAKNDISALAAFLGSMAGVEFKQE